MKIKRDTYLEKLTAREGNGLVKVVTGVRRCGKSYLLNVLFHGHLRKCGVPDTNIIRIAFDDVANRKLRDAAELRRVVAAKTKRRGRYYLLLDEVQLVENFTEALNGFAQQGNLDVYVTGSNARFLSKDIVTEFRGRGDQIHMAPLSFSEFVPCFNGHILDAWRQYVRYGGLPLVVTQRDEGVKVEYLNSIFQEVYLADLMNRNNIRHRQVLEDLLDVLSSSVGSLTNPQKLADTFKTVLRRKLSKNTVERYIGFLEDSFLIERVKRYDVKGRRYIGSPFKYYFSDIGLRNVRLNFRQSEPTHIMENVIYNELRFRGWNVDVGVVPVFVTENGVRSLRRYEIDFVCNKADARYYIQSAFSLPNVDKTEQEKKSFNQLNDSFRKIILTADYVSPSRDERGVEIINVYDFLANPKSLEK